MIQQIKDDWKDGDQFTTPETGDKVFTVSSVSKYYVEARDARSCSGYTSFGKDYVTKTSAPVENKEVLVVDNTDKDERIICAAIKLVESGKIYYGHRHNHCLEAMGGELSWTMNRQDISKVEKVQGFITNENKFVTREEAWVIAEKANQIIRQSGGSGTLYSEDLY